MRRHERFGRLAPRIDAERFAEIVRPEHLIAARLDPGYATHEGILDLTFASSEAVVLVPWLIVQGMMLLERESSPFIWPVWLPPLRPAIGQAIEERVEPWLLALTIARYCSEEQLRLFTDDPERRDLVQAAARCGLMGAAETERVLRSLAPYVYAQRFGRDNRIAILDEDGANGASLLARNNSVDTDLGSLQLGDLARRWFDLDAFHGIDRERAYDVAILREHHAVASKVCISLDGAPFDGAREIAVARPIPPSITVSFDRSDADVTRTFAVRAPASPQRSSSLAPMRIVGGSAGRIAVVVRDDFEQYPDADSDAAQALVARLREQDFTPTLLGVSRFDAAAYDLLHAVGPVPGPLLAPAVVQARQRGIPVVAAPYADDPASEGAWGAAGSMLALRIGYDAASRAYYGAAVSRRKLDAPGVPPIGSATPAQDSATRSALQACTAAVVAAAEEEQHLRTLGFAGEARVVPALLGEEPSTCNVSALTGLDEFVLVHAPMEPRCNQFALAVAAASAGLPIVLCGSVADVEYYTRTMAVLGDAGVWLPEEELQPAEIATLYGRARVFADASWSARGLYRLARAGAYGCALVAPASGYARNAWPGHVQSVDPGSSESVAEGLRVAWERAPRIGPATAARIAESCDPFISLIAVLATYQVPAGTPV
jgi:hypothetical protein